VSAFAFYAVLALSICIATAEPAYAYLDPGTGSIILQSIIGAVAAGLVVGRVYLHRFKTWFSSFATSAQKDGKQSSE
jgi:hypothetical protein